MIPILSREDTPSDQVKDDTHYVLGGSHAGIAIAERLHTDGLPVTIIDEAYKPSGVRGICDDPSAIDVLSENGVDTASAVIIATRSDRRNLLIAQLVRARFDVPRVIVFVNDPDRLPLFAEAGHESFCVTTALAEAVGEII